MKKIEVTLCLPWERERERKREKEKEREGKERVRGLFVPFFFFVCLFVVRFPVSSGDVERGGREGQVPQVCLIYLSKLSIILLLSCFFLFFFNLFICVLYQRNITFSKYKKELSCFVSLFFFFFFFFKFNRAGQKKFKVYRNFQTLCCFYIMKKIKWLLFSWSVNGCVTVYGCISWLDKMKRLWTESNKSGNGWKWLRTEWIMWKEWEV